MRNPTYEQKYEQAVRERETTDRIKSEPPRGAKTYIQKRLKDLKTVRNGVGKGR